MAERGWKATGRLEPLWSRLKGKRDELAELTGIGGTTLSGYNSGERNLGMRNAVKIADALGVSVYDLGAPRVPQQQFLLSMVGQILTELQRDIHAADPADLLSLADEFRRYAAVLEAVVAAQADDGLPA